MNELEKLMPFPDYIQFLERRVLEERESIRDCDRLFVQRTIFYRIFFQEKLTLGMLVPCDEEGNVLKEPKSSLLYQMQRFECSADEMRINRIYQQAKERVLFKGFTAIDTRSKTQIHLVRTNTTVISDVIQNDFAGLYFLDASLVRSRLNTIEDLLKFKDIELTNAAKKKLGYE